MAKPLRSQLNQIRAWVRQGRTDAWIAHQLEVSTSELREFRRRHELDADAEADDSAEADLRDEIEAEVAAAADEEGEDEEDEDQEERPKEPEREEGATDEDGGEPRGRRRRRRRRRGPRRTGAGLQATFDHGETEGYGLWLDPAVTDDPIYTEHWAGHRQVEVTLEPDRIVIKRTE